MKSVFKKIVFGIFPLIVLGACSPINRFTRVRETPNVYSRNYCCGQVAVSKSMDKKNPWIVYSDRGNNKTYYRPGGKVVLKETAYMEPFAVIGEKGDFLKLVKFNPSAFENGKLKDLSQLEYYGWVKKDHLLLSSHAVTDVATGFVIKMVTMLKDTSSLERLDNFISEGSVVLYQEPEMLTPIGKVPFQQPLFLLKKSADNRKCFVVGKERFSPEESSSVVSGWIPSSLLMPLGEYLYWNYQNVPITKSVLTANLNIGEKHCLVADSSDWSNLNPIYAIKELDENSFSVHTTVSVPVLDMNGNFVYGLSGKTISRSAYEKALVDKKHINVMLVFSGQRQVYDRFGQLVSSFQQMDDMLKKYDSDFRLGYCVGFDSGTDGMGICPLNANVSEVLSSLEHYADLQQNRPASLGGDAWMALKKALPSMSDYRSECNVLVLVGENGNLKGQVESSLIDDLVNLNCRIVGCQIYSNQGNSFNNFVLQVEDMISRSSDKLVKQKKDLLVHSEQLSPNNQYREISENVYALDYPLNSMWQGRILFPKKKESLSPDLLLSELDSLLAEAVVDNNDIIAHLQNSFHKVGTGRSIVNPVWSERMGIATDTLTDLLKPICSLNPYTRFSLNMELGKKEMKKGEYVLFLTETELDRIRQFLRDLTLVRVDYRYSASATQKKQKYKSCVGLFEQEAKALPDTLPRTYVNTSKVRRSMQKAFLYWANEEKVYPTKKRTLKQMSLSQNQQLIFSLPASSELLDSYSLRSLRKKKVLTDRDLDELQEYYLLKQRKLEDAIISENRFDYNGQIYYRIGADCLP